MENTTMLMEISSASYVGEDKTYFWDNHTIPREIYNNDRNKHSFFLIGMAFLAGIAAGFLLQCIYTCVVRYLENSGEEHPITGMVNVSFIGDDSRPDDNPPDYDTVVSASATGGAVSEEKQSFLSRIFRRKQSDDSETGSNSMEEVPPPSYSSVVTNLEMELNNR